MPMVVTTRGMLMRAAPVSKPLAPVKRMCQAGRTVVFDEASTGEINWLRDDDGNYLRDSSVPPGCWR